jgi:hypothetical protein
MGYDPPGKPERGTIQLVDTLSDPYASAASEFFSKRKRDRSPGTAGCSSALPNQGAVGHYGIDGQTPVYASSRRGSPPESRNGGPIPPFLQEKLSEDAAPAGSDSDNVPVGSSKPVGCPGPFRRNLPPVRSICGCRIRVLFQKKAGSVPRDGGLFIRIAETG